MNWKPGDTAICVKTGVMAANQNNPPPLRLKLEYPVHAVHKCDCGIVLLDVGISSPEGVLCVCGAKTSPKSGIWWCLAKRFVKKDLKSKEEQIAEAVANEDYELASKLSS